MKMLILLLLTLTALAAAEPTITPIGSLRLLDGRTLKNVVVRSYDAQASKVLVIADNKAMLIPINLIPPPLAERILSDVKRTTPELVQTTPTPPTAPTQPDTAPSTGVPVPTPFQPSPPPQPTSPAPTAPPTSIATVADPRKAHRAVAAAHARRYYKYEYRTGSNAIAVTDSDIAFEKTEPVPGWTNRYRTTGKVFLEVYDSVGGGSFRRGTSKFEILTEQTPGEDIQVVDFTRK